MASIKASGLYLVVQLGAALNKFDRLHFHPLLQCLVFGQPLLGQTLAQLTTNAATALAGASGQGVSINDQTPPVQALAAIPAWALQDFGAALRDLASPWFLGALLASAGLFVVLVQWRQRGAGHAG